ncbi:MAG: NAD-dependent epimerase/dehydratase family protein [Bacteroidia bacterium]
MSTKTLIIGSSGQIGTDLALELRKQRGNDNVICSDLKPSSNSELADGPFEVIDVMDKNRIEQVIKKYEIKEVYLLAALLSATAEKNPKLGWELNMEGLFNLLNIAKDGLIDKLFWPSSIAVFGPTTPRYNTPQQTVMEPTTVYGISKQAGERWCEYYFNKFGVDVRSIRYPGLISYKSAPGGGTTDYAVEIFHEAKKHKTYTCFLSENSGLPMMYMPDAIKATIQLMEAPKEKIKTRSSYNLSGMSFTPKEIAEAIKQHIPEFTIDYKPDFRQAIADSWPASIDDSVAQKEWGWKADYDLNAMVADMLMNVES